MFSRYPHRCFTNDVYSEAIIDCPTENRQFPQFLRWAENYNPQNTLCIPAVKNIALLELVKILQVFVQILFTFFNFFFPLIFSNSTIMVGKICRKLVSAIVFGNKIEV